MASEPSSLLELIKDRAPLQKITSKLESFKDSKELLTMLTEKADGDWTTFHHVVDKASPEVVKTLSHRFDTWCDDTTYFRENY